MTKPPPLPHTRMSTFICPWISHRGSTSPREGMKSPRSQVGIRAVHTTDAETLRNLLLSALFIPHGTRGHFPCSIMLRFKGDNFRKAPSKVLGIYRYSIIGSYYYYSYCNLCDFGLSISSVALFSTLPTPTPPCQSFTFPVLHTKQYGHFLQSPTRDSTPLRDPS